MTLPYELTPEYLAQTLRKDVLDRARLAAGRANRREFGKILQQRGTSFTGLYTFHLTVEDEALIAQMRTFVGTNIIYSETIEAAKVRFAPAAKLLLTRIITTVAEAQEDGAFPQRYLNPILLAVARMPEPVVGGVAPYFAFVDIPDLQSYLGSPEEFELAYHHGATLKKGIGDQRRDSSGHFIAGHLSRHNILNGPINESSLRYPAGSRYRYWKALSEGKTSFRISTGNSFGISNTGKSLGFTSTDSVDVQIAGSWQETIDARLAVWAETKKAPQWILLEHGQPRWSPKIRIPAGMSHSATGRGKADVSELRTHLMGDLPSPAQAGAALEAATTTTIYPGNITGEWIESMNALWSSLVSSIWTKQIEEFNKTHTSVNIDTKSNRYRNPRTGRYMRLGTPEPVLPTRAGGSVEGRAYGRKGGSPFGYADPLHGTVTLDEFLEAFEPDIPNEDWGGDW